MKSATRQRQRASPATAGNPRTLGRLLADVLAYAREREYTGWDYGDGMSSRILRALPFENKWLNLAFQESVKRSPVNLRPLLLVEPRPNYKGMALFAMANLNAHRLSTRHGLVPEEVCEYATEARRLAEWLRRNRSEGYGGFCGGYQHAFQGLADRGDPGDPDLVSTSYAVKAFLRAADLDATYPELARTATGFVDEELSYRRTADGALVDYHLNHGEGYTINAGAIGARMFVDLYAQFGDRRYLERASALLDHVSTLQTDIGGWHYRDPPDASHLSMDSFHNGFIIESYQRFHEVVGPRYADTLASALAFYRDRLFDPDGAPNWEEDSTYPRDIHAAAQGVLVFTYAGDLEFAGRILEWVLEHLYAGDGRFYYRKHRLYTKRYTLMRWCQAWMAFAISEFLDARLDGGDDGRSTEYGGGR
jgi:hypothetical protein